MSRLTPRSHSASRRSRIRIEVANHQQLFRVNTQRIREAVRRVLELELIREAELELALVEDATIQRVHRDHLDLNTPTDVLTFPMHAAGEPMAGVIVVSVETARRVAPDHENTVEGEIMLYAIHGVLHLCGYDDLTPSKARRMRRRQSELLRQIMVSK